MQRVLISVEGQTEEIFVRDVLAPHLADAGVAARHVILKTKRPAGAPTTQLESAIQGSLGDRRLCPYLQVHEFEALVFAAPSHVATRAGSAALEGQLADIARSLGGPERVDDGPHTAPSKRLASLWPGYTKTLDGPAIVKAAGLAAIRAQCPHLDAWISGLEALGR